jgi:hypothetical protein
MMMKDDERRIARRTPFTPAAAELAQEEWGANCGPTALAAIMGLTLGQIRPHMGDFEEKGYTNPTMMFAALKSVGARYHCLFAQSPSAGAPWPYHGLARIQWHGPWMAPEAPPRWRYRHTHWVAVEQVDARGAIDIFDVNCLENGTGWLDVGDWSLITVPWLLRDVQRATGGWHITHSIEIAR